MAMHMPYSMCKREWVLFLFSYKTLFVCHAGSTYSDNGVLHIILGIVFALIVLVFISVCIVHRRRKARKKKNKKEIEVRYVTRNAAPSRGNNTMMGPCTDHLLKERTEKVSIVWYRACLGYRGSNYYLGGNNTVYLDIMSEDFREVIHTHRAGDSISDIEQITETRL